MARRAKPIGEIRLKRNRAEGRALGDQFFNHFHDIAAMFPDALAQVIVDTTEEIADLASGRAPVDTGLLEESDKERYNRGRSGSIQSSRLEYTAKNEEGGPYALFVEVGTHDTPAQPFLVPAVMEARGHFIARLEHLEDRFKEAIGE